MLITSSFRRAALKIVFEAALVAVAAGQGALANSISIVNEVFSDSNSVISVSCYNGGGSQGPGGLNCNPAGFVWDHAPYASASGTSDTLGVASNVIESLNLASPSGEGALAVSTGNFGTGSVTGFTQATSGAEATTSSALHDVVHFHVAGATDGTVTPITITWSFSGMLSGDFLGFQGAPVGASSSLNFGGIVGASEDIFGGPPELTSAGQSGWVTSAFLSETPSLVQFTGVYNLVGSSVDLPMDLVLSTFASNGDKADFSHTSQVGLILPGNVTFTSDSGTFLTGVSAVPEPGTFVLMGFALAGLGATRLKRRS